MSSLCVSCKNFVHRARGKNGGLKGICNKSVREITKYLDSGELRGAGTKAKCARYIPE